MAKEVVKKIKLQLEAGKATPAPPVGTVLGPAGVNLQDFCSKNNISHSRLVKFKNSIVPDNINTRIRNYEKVMNTNGYKLIIV